MRVCFSSNILGKCRFLYIFTVYTEFSFILHSIRNFSAVLHLFFRSNSRSSAARSDPRFLNISLFRTKTEGTLFVNRLFLSVFIYKTGYISIFYKNTQLFMSFLLFPFRGIFPCFYRMLLRFPGCSAASAPQLIRSCGTVGNTRS